MKENIIDFLNCQIDLSKKVFKPRIETEYWLKQVLTKLQIADFKLQIEKGRLDILDIFAGSGCVGVAVLKNVPNSRVDFADISSEAIKQIKINLHLNKIPEEKYRIIQSDMFERVGDKLYDFIFANPPYVALERINEVEKQVLETEPHNSLFAGEDGMDYIKKFLKQVRNYLKPKGIFFLEFDHLQKQEIEQICKKQWFQFNFFKDQFGKYRWLQANV